MKSKKLFALLLAVLMLLTVAPVGVFAANLPIIQNVKITSGEGMIGVKWDVPQYPASKDVLGYNVLYSTDKVNWQLMGTVTRDSGARDFREPEEGAFVHGTTYYVCVQPYDWNHNPGPLSAPVSVSYTNPDGQLRAEWEAVMAGYKAPTKETGAKYDKVKLVKGEKVVWDNGLYTLTVQIASVSAAKAKLNVTLKNKTGATFECFYINWKGQSAGMGISIHEGTKSFDVDLTKLSDGANYFQFSMTGYGNPVAKYSSVARGSEYSDYGEKMIYLGRKHTLYFQKAPNAGKIAANEVSATSSSITVGKGYKTVSKDAKGSGTIVYYRVDGTKKFSKKTFAAGKALKLPKLKANTLYEIKAINYVKALSAADNKTVVTSKSGYSNRIWIRTAVAAAPEIQSIKVSGAKVGKIHVNGYWESDGDWHPAYDVTVTTYQITVTLKSAPKGIQGIKVTGVDRNGYPHWVKGTGKTFTINANAKGSARGKSVNIGIATFTNQFGSDSGYSGYSPVTKKAVTIR